MKRRPALLDVNVLLALFDSDHVHHEAAHDWFATNRENGWATCPLTENGFVRVLTNPAYGAVHETPAALLGRLESFCASGEHVFWEDDVSLRDPRVFTRAAGLSHRHLTDVYLLGLAKHRGGRLATFDRRIPLAAVVDAEPEHLEVVPA